MITNSCLSYDTKVNFDMVGDNISVFFTNRPSRYLVHVLPDDILSVDEGGAVKQRSAPPPTAPKPSPPPPGRKGGVGGQ